ncbi:MAG TPA: FAD-binding protein, partial [Candidatus Dormibacteraeota bacterium]|nr:FAD-binding protein [Candidatus Dormibacteraeota bacterium]
MNAELRAALAAATAERAVGTATVSPASTAEVAAVLRACPTHGARVRVASGPAPRPAVLPDGVAVLVCLGALDALAVDSAAGVARAGAGTPLAALRAALDSSRLTLASPAVPRSPAPSHVGSLVARGGLARRAVCGVEAVLGTGEVVRAGGAVQRDVTGFDLIAALLGSEGRLAVVTAVWLRLQPASAAVVPHDAQGPVEPGVMGD